MLNLMIHGGVWVSLSFYLASSIFQILINYKFRSARGLSDFALLMLGCGHLASLYYLFLTPLPLSYKVIGPFHSIAAFILVGQRLYYDGFLKHRWFSISLLSALFIAMVYIPIARQNPIEIGGQAGWLFGILLMFQPLPQMIKIFREKSVEGFSFYSVLFGAIAAVVELAGAIILRLPAQIFFFILRGMFFQIIFFFQFWLYHRRGKTSSSEPQ